VEKEGMSMVLSSNKGNGLSGGILGCRSAVAIAVKSCEESFPPERPRDQRKRGDLVGSGRPMCFIP